MRQVEYKGYTFFEDGTFINKRGRLGNYHIKDKRYIIKLTINKKRETFMYHRLRHYLFVENFDFNDRDICVIAKDGNYLNLDLNNYTLMKRENLYSLKKNIKVLSKETVKQIREEYADQDNNINYFAPEYKSMSYLAAKYGVSKSLIRQIVNRDVHKDI